MSDSNILDRKNHPRFSSDFKLPELNWKEELVAGKIPVHFINAGSQEVVKIDFGFNAGELFQGKNKLALACNSLLREGTSTMTSAHISEAFDFYGAYFETGIDKDFAGVTLFSSNRFLTETLPLFLEVISDPAFSEKELSIWKENKIQKLKVDLQKVDFIAKNTFPGLIFGEKSPYGKSTTESDYRTLNTNDLKEFYQKNYLNGVRYIVVSGKMSPQIETLILEALNQKFSGLFHPGNNESFENAILDNNPSKKLVEQKEALQSAIRIGRPLFNRLHPDYIEFSVLNTLLGGYFGSRLMTNIREDKGFTYGIGSGLNSFLKGGQWLVATEVGAEVTSAAIHEIYFEIDRIINEPVSAEELDLVKNYMLGNFLRSMDGPFALSERLSLLLNYQLKPDYLIRVLERIKATDAAKIQQLAHTYLQKKDLSELVVGKLI